MTQDRTTSLFFEIFHGLPRQGPGDTASTIKALRLVPGIGRETRVLDLGCGTGLQTRVLAQHSPAHFVAIDNHVPFVEEANGHAQALGLADRVETRVGDLRQPDFAPGSFDLIWCEGAIYVIGFEAGLRAWRPLLAPGGHLAVTEVCWSRPDPPEECAEFWAREYPAIRDPAALLTIADTCGYDSVGHFCLPASSWWDEPLRTARAAYHRVLRLSSRRAGRELVADHMEREIDIWHAYSAFYHYEFFVRRTRHNL